MRTSSKQVVDRNCFKPFQERSRHRTSEKQESKFSPSRFVPTVQEGIGSFKKKIPDAGMLPPSCSTPSFRSGRHSIAGINLNDTLLSKLYPQTKPGNVPPKNTSSSSSMMGLAGSKLDHPRLRQRRASLPQGLALDRDRSFDLPKLKTIKLQPERGHSKLAIDKESKANQNVKLGNFSRHVDGA